MSAAPMRPGGGKSRPSTVPGSRASPIWLEFNPFCQPCEAKRGAKLCLSNIRPHDTSMENVPKVPSRSLAATMQFAKQIWGLVYRGDRLIRRCGNMVGHPWPGPGIGSMTPADTRLRGEKKTCAELHQVAERVVARSVAAQRRQGGSVFVNYHIDLWVRSPALTLAPKTDIPGLLTALQHWQPLPAEAITLMLAYAALTGTKGSQSTSLPTSDPSAQPLPFSPALPQCFEAMNSEARPTKWKDGSHPAVAFAGLSHLHFAANLDSLATNSCPRRKPTCSTCFGAVSLSRGGSQPGSDDSSMQAL